MAGRSLVSLTTCDLAEEMAQQSPALAAPEDLGSVPSTYMAA